MTTERASSPTRAALLTAVAALTTWCALTAWTPFVTDATTFLPRLAAVALALVLVGSVLRALDAPFAVVAIAQTMVSFVVVSTVITGSPFAPGAVGRSLDVAVAVSREFAAPIGPGAPPIWPLLVVSGAAALLIVDLVACSLHRVAGAGLVLLAVYAVPSGLTDESAGVWGFVLAALGFAALLYLDHLDSGSRWGRRVARPADDRPASWGSAVGGSLGTASRIAVAAVVVAVAVPVAVPQIGLQLFDVGSGSGNDDIRIRKPVADMKRDLERGADIPLIEVDTDDPDPSYLRISVLNRYTGEQWSSGDRDVASEDRADGPLPRAAGLDEAVPVQPYDYRVTVSRRFDSTWLPTSYPAAAVDARGDWRFDPATLDVLAAKDGLTTSGLTYSMTALRPQYGTDGRFFRDSASGQTSAEVRTLPEVPQLVEDLARSVTERADNDYERALLLQRWFRQDGGFTYDLASAPDGMGNDTLESFLSPSGRVGYCEQYASAMAVMARVLGIPSRIAVGFLRPEQLDDGTWQYSAHDLHAWPELFFAGAGWVRFEPTPAGRAAETPDYSRVRVQGAEEAPEDATSAAPSTAPTGPSSTAPSTAPEERVDEAAAEQGAGSGPGRLLVLGLVGLAVLALAGVLAWLPRSLRATARRGRRSAGGAEGAWAELRATALDLALPWPEDRSPREVGTVLMQHLGDPDGPGAEEAGDARGEVERPRTGPDAAPRAAAALESLVLAVERERYARPQATDTPAAPAAGSSGRRAVLERTASLTDDLDLVVASLAAGAGPRAQRRAAWAPRSVWRRD
ncbi:transglutaminaseTgpA domain-containing protein [Nocardioides sp.]|uniref:transglutaminaseTgpA domain-containing protein n=1 Tax=Nocardioides sp. TaxID=35761 RepID=UPI003513A904